MTNDELLEQAAVRITSLLKTASAILSEITGLQTAHLALEAENDDLRKTIGIYMDRVVELEQDDKNAEKTPDKLADLLSRTAVALKGEEPPLTKWSWHDLPEAVAAKQAKIDKFETIIAYAYQIAGAHDCPEYILDVLSDPEEATVAQIHSMLPYVAAATPPPEATEVMIHAAEDLPAPRHFGVVYRTMVQAHARENTAPTTSVVPPLAPDDQPAISAPALPPMTSRLLANWFDEAMADAAKQCAAALKMDGYTGADLLQFAYGADDMSGADTFLNAFIKEITS